MPTTPYPVQIDHRFKTSWHRYSFWAGLTILVGFTVTMIEIFHSQRFGLTGVIGFGSFAVGVYLMNRRLATSLQNYCCPSCRMPIATPQRRSLEPTPADIKAERDPPAAVHFDCDYCQTTWDTTLRDDPEEQDDATTYA